MPRTAEIDIDMVKIDDPIATPLDYLFQDPYYRDQDDARLAAWRQDEWHFVGICARAKIKIPYGINLNAGSLLNCAHLVYGASRATAVTIISKRSIRESARSLSTCSPPSKYSKSATFLPNLKHHPHTTEGGSNAY